MAHLLDRPLLRRPWEIAICPWCGTENTIMEWDAQSRCCMCRRVLFRSDDCTTVILSYGRGGSMLVNMNSEDRMMPYEMRTGCVLLAYPGQVSLTGTKG